ncbi:MAG: LemA family protein [Candidatus Colwellbacteria bacterium]|nr:LemA family protein [Candidatus Colwellbacteria bacterium]
MNTLYIALVIFGVVILWVIMTYNGLVTLRNRLREALSDIDVQEKRRFDLIPNLVEMVKGYMAHERGVLENVTRARASVSQAGNPLERDKSENMLSGALKTLFAVAESYPDLKANTNFLSLQSELSDTEDKIQAARRFYNSTVMDLNSTVESFPANLIAGTFGFKSDKFFETTGEEDRPVPVKF